MKKSLLFLSMLGLASSAQAQINLGPWTQVNTVNSAAFAPGYRVDNVHTVSPTVSWAVARENSVGSRPSAFFVTNNAAGTQFEFGAVNAPNGSAGFQVGNISGISATVAVAATYPVMGAGGEILRTANGGASWTKVSTASQFPGGQGGFCNFVHMFDALEGVSLGDVTNGYFEVLRTTDGGLTWTRRPQASTPAPLPDEFGNARAFFARGNTIWAGLASGTPTNPVRVFKSTDRGLTWTASAITTLLGSINRLAFKDDLNGICYNSKDNAAGTAVGEVNVIRTSDGGATWSPITPINVASGSFFWFDIDAINGRYYSTGARFPSATPTVAADFGTSYSTDGINWTSVSSGQGFFAFDMVAQGTANAQGFAGGATDAAGVGGLYKTSSVLASRDAALQNSLNAYPNPSASGVFKVDFGATLKAGAQLTVVDVMGRQVQSQTLNATTVGSKTLNLDLSGEKAGVYTLQIRTEAGIATQKLVIE